MTGREAEGPSLQAEREIETPWEGSTIEKPTEAWSSRGHLPLHLQKNHRRQALRLDLAPVTWRHLHWEAREHRPLWVMQTEDCDQAPDVTELKSESLLDPDHP